MATTTKPHQSDAVTIERDLPIESVGVDATPGDAAVVTVQHRALMYPTAFNDGNGLHDFDGAKCTLKDRTQLLYAGWADGRRCTLRFDRKTIRWSVMWAPRLVLVQ